MSSENTRNKQYNLLKKYFEDAATNEEKKLVNEWFNDPENITGFENSLKVLWQETDTEIRGRGIDLDALLDKVHHAINLTGRKEQIVSLPVRSGAAGSFSRVLRNIARVAAILLLPLMVYIGWEIYSQKMWMKNQSEIVYNEIICPLGARSQFELPDGTTGSLNNGSRLRYPMKFYGKTREVELVGEAFFDVSHDNNRPFVINTDGLDVKVLGTKLNVYSYPGEGYQEFTLESGTIELIKKENNRETSIANLKPGQHALYRFDEDKVNVVPDRSEEESITVDNRKDLNKFLSTMKPGEHAVYEMKEGEIDIKFDETDYYTAWKEGKLVLRNDPMPNLLKRIERWYNVKFNVLDESIADYTYWATFEEESLEQVLNLLSLTGPIEFKKHPREQMPDGTYKVQEIDIMLKNKYQN